MSVDWRSTDPFHRSTGCPTESWVLSVGRPSSILVHVVHVGRPDRSTDLLLLRAVDRTSAPTTVSCFLLLLLPCPFVVDFLGDHSATPRRSLSTSSAIVLSFQQFSTSAKILPNLSRTVHRLESGYTNVVAYVPCPRDQAVRSSSK